jgi:hypothetical protein
MIFRSKTSPKTPYSENCSLAYYRAPNDYCFNAFINRYPCSSSHTMNAVIFLRRMGSRTPGSL